MEARNSRANLNEHEEILQPKPRQLSRALASGRTVLATGAFDLLHPGHLRFLEESKKAGGPRAKLIVIVARDRTILGRKGREPVMPEAQRLEMVQALKPVTRAMLGHQEIDLLGILQQIKPDIVAVGHDQSDIKRSVQRILRENKLPIKLVQIRHFGPRGRDSSTSLKNQVAKNLAQAR